MDAERPRSDSPPLPRPSADLDWRERLDRARERAVDVVDTHPVVRQAVTVGLLAAAAVVAFLLLRPPSTPAPVETLLPPVDPVVTTPVEAPVETTIVVHVAGAVRRPGLAELPAGSRVADAIAAGGGAADDADLDRLNLATVLGDGDHVAVPRMGEEPPALIDAVERSGADEGSATGPVDLNRAGTDELEALPGVGPATAAAIVAHRDEHGPFTAIGQLVEVPGIGPAKLARVRDLVTVGQ